MDEKTYLFRDWGFTLTVNDVGDVRRDDPYPLSSKHLQLPKLKEIFVDGERRLIAEDGTVFVQDGRNFNVKHGW